MKCRNCGTSLSEGKDAFQLQEGVMGYQRFVPLADPFYFCCRECLKQHFTDSSSNLSAPRRIP